MLEVRVDAPVGSLRVAAAFELASPWTVLFGPSGSGKSSLLRLVAGLWRPRDAAVLLDGVDLATVPAYQRRIGLVAQQVALFPHLTVRGNVGFGATDAGWVAELMEAFGLSALAAARTATLSGGERQRVALARALGARPRWLLLDEVFTGMHAQLRVELMGTLRGYGERLGMPILSVTHDVAEALQADAVVAIREGRVVAQGLPGAVLAAELEGLLAQLQTSV